MPLVPSRTLVLYLSLASIKIQLSACKLIFWSCKLHKLVRRTSSTVVKWHLLQLTRFNKSQMYASTHWEGVFVNSTEKFVQWHQQQQQYVGCVIWSWLQQNTIKNSYAFKRIPFMCNVNANKIGEDIQQKKMEQIKERKWRKEWKSKKKCIFRHTKSTTYPCKQVYTQPIDRWSKQTNGTKGG